MKLLELLPYCKTRWGSWEGVIARLIIFKAVSKSITYFDLGSHTHIFQAVQTFTNTADDSDKVPNVDKGQPKYSSYRLSDDEWDLLRLIQIVLKIRNHSHDIILPAANSVTRLHQKFKRHFLPSTTLQFGVFCLSLRDLLQNGGSCHSFQSSGTFGQHLRLVLKVSRSITTRRMHHPST